MIKYKLSLINKDEENDLISFLNKCFMTDFKRLVPKIYMHPVTDNHYVVKDNGKIIGAICVRYDEWLVDDCKLKIAGIGSVCVDKEYRNRGIMSFMLDEVHKIIKDQSDIAILSGKYERYHHFGYEKVSLPYRYRIDGESDRYHFRRITDLNDDEIEKIYAISQKDVHILMNKEDLIYALEQWDYEAYGIYDDDKLCGYIMNNDEEVSEIRSLRDIKEVLKSFKGFRHVDYAIMAPYEYSNMRIIDNEWTKELYDTSQLCRIFNYEKVIEIMLNHKNNYQNLASFDISIMVDGYGIIRINKDENFKVMKKSTGKYDLRMSEEEFFKTLLNSDFHGDKMMNQWPLIDVYLYIKDLI